MIIVSYDFSNDKRRAKFAKFLKQYGEKVQYSVYRIRNSQRVLNIILTEIAHNYEKKFEDTDSIYIFSVCQSCLKKIKRYGSARHEEEDVIYLS